MRAGNTTISGTISIDNGTTFDNNGYGFVHKFTFVLNGNVITGNDQTNWVLVPRAGKFTKCYINAKTAPVDASLVCDILRSNDFGATFTSLWDVHTSWKPTLATTAVVSTQTNFDIGMCAEGDLLRIDVLSVGYTIPGSNVIVTLLALVGNN